MIRVPEGFTMLPVENNKYLIETLDGEFAVLPASWGEEEGVTWETIGKWCRKNKIKAMRKQWLKECEHKNWKPKGKIQCLYPIG